MALSGRKYPDAKKLLIERANEYIVTPHFRGLMPRVEALNECINKLKEDMMEWIISFVKKRPYWMDYCID